MQVSHSLEVKGSQTGVLKSLEKDRSFFHISYSCEKSTILKGDNFG